MTQEQRYIMTTAGPAETSTPKRKRTQLVVDDAEAQALGPSSPADIALPPSSPADDGSTSPRTKVAHRFRSLAIGRPRSLAGTAVKERLAPAARDSTSVIPETSQPKSKSTSGGAMEQDTDGAARKRLKQDEAPQLRNEGEDDLPNLSEANLRTKPTKQAPTFAVERPATPSPRKSTSSPADYSEPSPTTDGPAAQPGPSFQWPPSPPDTSISPQVEPMTVAFRASMTWQEDEITIYDPDDSDDDGTGINGIGFKPTAAVAYARGVKRKQQLADYRKREEREARARRSQRRRAASPRPPVGGDDKSGKKGDREREKRKEKERRRVRFLEASASPMPAPGPAPLATGS